MRRTVAAFAALAALAAWAPVALAQDLQSSTGALTPPAGVRSGIGIDRPYWSAGEPRPFAAATFDVAGLGARTELDVGYGRPHFAWGGLEVQSGLSLRALLMSAGARVTLPWLTLRAGARYQLAFQQKLVPFQAEVSRPELDADEGARSRYLSIDAEASTEIPLPVGAIGLLGSAHRIVGVDEEYLLFEESLRAMIAEPFVWRVRGSYMVGIGDPETLRIGGLVEVMHNPRREASWVRVGPVVVVSLTHHLEALGVAAFVAHGPDIIGLAGADLGQIGLRYRWASGDVWPDFP